MKNNLDTKDIIYCIVGPSGCGKTTVAESLNKLGYNVIQSYTTRNKRHENEWGHTFITEEEYLDIINPKSKNHKKLIAYEKLYDKYHYFATEDQYKGKGNSIYVVTPIATKELQDALGKNKVKIISLTCDPQVTHDRMINDGRPETDIQKRLKADKDIFNKVKYDFKVDTNKSKENVIDNIINILERKIVHE